MPQVTTSDARTNLSALLRQVQAGEVVVITRYGRPVARLVPVDSRSAGRVPGLWKGKVEVAPDFDELKSDELRDWYGGKEG